MSLVASDPLAELEELRALTAQLQAELYAKNLYIEKLKAQLATLKQARFGRSSEKLDRLIEQLELTITDLEEGEAQADIEQTQDRSSVTPPTLAGKTKTVPPQFGQADHRAALQRKPENRQHGAGGVIA